MKISNRILIFIIAAVLVLAAAAGGAIWYFRPAGTQVLVTINGAEFGTYPLNKNQTVIIQPEDKSWHNTLVIQNGHAEITESDCSNQICVYTPALSEEMIGIIVCLPHGVAVELK